MSFFFVLFTWSADILIAESANIFNPLLPICRKQSISSVMARRWQRKHSQRTTTKYHGRWDCSPMWWRNSFKICKKKKTSPCERNIYPLAREIFIYRIEELNADLHFSESQSYTIYLHGTQYIADNAVQHHSTLFTRLSNFWTEILNQDVNCPGFLLFVVRVCNFPRLECLHLPSLPGFWIKECGQQWPLQSNTVTHSRY